MSEGYEAPSLPHAIGPALEYRSREHLEHESESHHEGEHPHDTLDRQHVVFDLHDLHPLTLDGSILLPLAVNLANPILFTEGLEALHYRTIAPPLIISPSCLTFDPVPDTSDRPR